MLSDIDKRDFAQGLVNNPWFNEEFDRLIEQAKMNIERVDIDNHIALANAVQAVRTLRLAREALMAPTKPQRGE